MKIKMFGTSEPDFTGGAESLKGSHHTVAFYRKGIGYFMPGGVRDWDPSSGTGNPTRSREVRSFISMIKDLNMGGDVVPRKRGRPRGSTGATGGDLCELTSKRRKREATSDELSEEVGLVIRRMIEQRDRFLRNLKEIGGAVDRMKRDVEASYGLMIGHASNVAASIPRPQSGAGAARVKSGAPLSGAGIGADGAHATASSAAAHRRSRNLFTTWTIANGRLAPVPPTWTFPPNLTAADAIELWLLGEPSTGTPPMRYLSTAHLRHVKGAESAFLKVKRFIKIIEFLAVSKAGFWCERWSNARISTLWRKVCPEIESYIGPLSEEGRGGIVSCRTIVNSLSRDGALVKEMDANKQSPESSQAVEAVVKATEAMLKADSADGGTMDTSTTSPGDLELLWGIHDGKLNPLPATWEFPINAVMTDMISMWLIGEPEQKIPPLRYITASYVQFQKSGAGYLSKLRCVMKVVRHVATKLGCWQTEGVWDEESIASMWHAVYDDIVVSLKYKKEPVRDTIKWQSVYNKMHENGLIKSANAENEEAEDAVKDIAV